MRNYLGIPKSKKAKVADRSQPSSVVGYVERLVEDCDMWVQLLPQSPTKAGRQSYQDLIDESEFAVADLLDYQGSF